MAEPDCCPFCQTRVAVPASLAGRQVKCPHCGGEFTAPGAEGAGAAVVDRIPRPTRVIRFTFTCLRCGLALEAGSDLSETRGRCPTCGVVFTVPRVDPHTGLPTGPAVIDDDGQLPTPMHAYAAAGKNAPRVKRLASGDQVIVCPRCDLDSSIEADICTRCGLPFTIEGATAVTTGTTYASDHLATTSFVLGLLAIPTFCFPLLGVAAAGAGVASLMRPTPGGVPMSGRRMAYAGIACGVASMGLAVLSYLKIL